MSKKCIFFHQNSYEVKVIWFVIIIVFIKKKKTYFLLRADSIIQQLILQQ